MRKFSLLSVAVLLCAAASQVAFGSISAHYADPVPGIDKVMFTTSDEGMAANRGGPFIGTLYGSDGVTVKDVWKTFCVEADGAMETFSPGTRYNVLGTDLHVATATGNYVTDAAKWLYYQSLHNPSALAGYVPGTLASDTLLQEAIWHGVVKISGGGSLLGSDYNLYTGSLAETWFGAAAQATTGLASGWTVSDLVIGHQWADADMVWVINPGASASSQSQSMLYETPEPATLVVWSVLGVGGWLGIRMRRRRS